ncbi:neuromedin-U [Cetorhinus maximus]
MASLVVFIVPFFGKGLKSKECLMDLKSMKVHHVATVHRSLIVEHISKNGVPASPQRFPAEELRLWTEIDDLCSSFLSAVPPPQPSSTLEELCYMALTILHQPQDSEDRGQIKRFLFHYSKTHDSGNSDFMSSVLHPLLQLVPELHERRMKKGRGDEEFQGPGGIQSRGYFMFRPRNGRRSSSFR